MGPATVLTSPTRYSNIGTAGVELTTEPAGVDGAAALPAPLPSTTSSHRGQCLP